MSIPVSRSKGREGGMVWYGKVYARKSCCIVWRGGGVVFLLAWMVVLSRDFTYALAPKLKKN